MATGTLYTYPDSFRANKILVTAEYSGASIKVPSFKLGETNKTAEFLKKFPLGKVPAFETSEGHCIYESNAIAYYVANAQLRGTSELDAALVQQYVNLADHEILPAAATWVFPTLGLIQYNKQSTDKAMEDVKKCMSLLNEVLKTRTFLAGERVTLADISVGCTLFMLYQQVMDPAFRGPYVNVNRWFVTLVNQPQFKKVIGEVKLCTTMAKFDPKKFAELHPKDDKKAKKQKEQKPKEQKPKQEKPKKEVDEEEEAPKPKPKKDPYADLPPSSFDMDAFKRCYSNEDTATKAIPHFWENFDKEGYSIWRSDYKYNDELKRIFMTCNLVGGMLQRLGKLNKTGFASILIFGEDNNNSISGIWVLRGQQLAFDINEDWNIDAPSYTFKKLDPDNPDTRKMVNEYLLWEGDFEGRTVNQGKIFK